MESTERASYTKKTFLKETLRKKIINYVRMAGFIAIGGSSRPTIDKNIIFSQKYKINSFYNELS